MSSALHLRGPLVLKALEASLQTLVNRHEALRTTFPLVQDEPVQQIAPAWPVSLPIIDLQPLSSEERDQETARLRQTLEQDIPLSNLFEHPTVAQLASAIDTQLFNVFRDWPKDGS